MANPSRSSETDVSEFDDTSNNSDPSVSAGEATTDGAQSMTATQWAERRAARKQSRGLRSVRAAYENLPTGRRRALLVISVLIAVFLVATGVELAMSVGRVHPGVYVADVSVGGLTPDAAGTRLEKELVSRLADPVMLVFEEDDWSVESTTVAAALDTTTAVQAAMAIGRSGSMGSRVGARFLAWFSPVKLRAPVIGSNERVAAVIDEVAGEIDRDPTDASVRIEGTDATVEPSALGLAVRRDELAQAMLAAFASTERSVDIATDLVPVDVTDEAALAAAQDAEQLMSAPVTITHEDEEWEFSREEIAGWIGFRVEPGAESTASSSAVSSPSADGSLVATATEVPGTRRMALVAYIDAREASKTVTPRVGTAGRPAEDATFSVSNGTVSIVPHQDGLGPDIDALADELTVALMDDGNRFVELRTMRVEPALTTEGAKAMGIKERIGTYTTTFDSGNRPRVNNIHTLADAVDGTLIAPGETFAFNETVGPRTAAKGYQEAPAIVNGVLVPQLGGGICQFGTTIFNAVFESGLPVVERRNHSFYISHYPKGRDATVSWGGPDFKFKNDTEHYVLVATGHGAGSVTVSLYGTDPGYDISSNTGEWYDVKPHPVREIPDDSLGLGSRVVEDHGIDGRKIVVSRTVTKNGTVVREDKFTSVYKAVEEVVRVGTKPVTPPVPEP